MLFLGYESAVQYWRTVRAGLIPFPPRSHAVEVSNEDHLLKEIRDYLPDLPIDNQPSPHVLVSKTRLIHQSDEIAYHLCSKMLPRGSFCQHAYGVSISSPELSLLHAARVLGAEGFVSLLELCCEFMGCYSLYEESPRGFVGCQPLITRRRQIEYLDQLPPRTRGKALLRRATELVGENARSPRETACFLAMTLPPKMGGFGLPRPSMNPVIPLDEDEDLTDDRSYLVDLIWKEEGVVFEYDGQFDHSAPDRVLRDKERRSVLASMGYTVIVAVNGSMKADGPYLKKTAQVFRALGIPMRSFSDAERAAQSKLRSILFDHMHHYSSAYTLPIALKRTGQ